MNIKRVHYYAGIFITLFILLHLFNHFFSLLGAETHIKLMNNLRLVYRNIVVEFILLVSIGIQISSGIRLFLDKRKTASGFYGKLQIWTGLYLALFFIIHLSAVLGGRLFLGLDTNFYFGVAGLNSFPFNLFFLPYYGLAIISFFGHVSAVHFHKMKKNIFGLNPRKQAICILIIGIILTPLLFYGLTNGFNGVVLPSEYNILIGK